VDRPDVQTRRRAFLRTVRRIPIDRLVFLDESGVHVAMYRTHTWVKRGTEYIERVPMNWGRTLTLLGAMRHTGWVVLQTMFATANADRFVAWLTRHLLPTLRCGDVLVMDNLRAHHDRRVGPACRQRGIRVLSLPPYSPDLNPHRARMGAAEAAGAEARATHRRSSATSRTPRALSHHASALPPLVCACWLQSGSTQVIRGIRRKPRRFRRRARPDV
jgi:hypothetical protein